MFTVKKIAILTAGDSAPCLFPAIGSPVQQYTEVVPEVGIIAYKHGCQGFLQGDYLAVDKAARTKAYLLHMFGGSPVGDPRVRFTNVKDLVKRGLVAEGANPLKTAADRLVTDSVDILHAIGGDDTNTAAADLAAFLAVNDYPLVVAGLPKTIDNDVIPVRQSLSAWTAAEQRAIFAKNIAAEYNSGSRILIAHGAMERRCGWLTAAAAAEYREWLDTQEWLPGIGLSREAQDVHVVYMPKTVIDITAGAERLNKVMDEVGSVAIFLSEGAGLNSIVAGVEAAGEEVPRDLLGHVKFNKVSPGKWFGDKPVGELGAEKVIIRKSGYFSRSATANEADLTFAKQCTSLAVDYALVGRSDVIGRDKEDSDELTVIAFERIKSDKPFDITLP